jgi:hypothetical protein
MNISILFPCEPFNLRNPDMDYQDEYNQAKAMGFNVFLFDIDELKNNGILSSNIRNNNTTILYRGWMLSPSEYKTLYSNVIKNCEMLVSPEQYIHSHYLPSWIDSLQQFTMQTIISTEDSVVTDFEKSGWKSAFIKDYVKSLTTSRGSIAYNSMDIQHIVAEIKHKRGLIDGGICLREVVSLSHEEERYFIYNQKAFSRDGNIPQIVLDIAEIHIAPFYSVDIAKLQSGQLILIEVGDGQVSDIKKWQISDFIKIFI